MATTAYPAGCKTTRQLHTLVMGAVRRIAQQYQGQKVMVVTHGGVLDMIWRIARGTALDGPRQSDIPNTDLNRVRVNCKEVVDWAVVRHLANLSEQSVYDQKKPLVR